MKKKVYLVIGGVLACVAFCAKTIYSYIDAYKPRICDHLTAEQKQYLAKEFELPDEAEHVYAAGCQGDSYRAQFGPFQNSEEVLEMLSFVNAEEKSIAEKQLDEQSNQEKTYGHL